MVPAPHCLAIDKPSLWQSDRPALPGKPGPGAARCQKSMCRPNCTIRGTFNCVLSTPKPCGDCRFTDGSANCTTLKALKTCALKVVLQRSLKRNFREIARSTFQRGRPRSCPPAPLVVSMPTIAGRNELNTATGLPNRFKPLPPRAGSPLTPTCVLESPVTPEWTLLPNVSAVVSTAPPLLAPPPCPNS